MTVGTAQSSPLFFFNITIVSFRGHYHDHSAQSSSDRQYRRHSNEQRRSFRIFLRLYMRVFSYLCWITSPVHHLYFLDQFLINRWSRFPTSILHIPRRQLFPLYLPHPHTVVKKKDSFVFNIDLAWPFAKSALIPPSDLNLELWYEWFLYVFVYPTNC